MENELYCVKVSGCVIGVCKLVMNMSHFLSNDSLF